MAKITALTELTTGNVDGTDYMVVVDESTGITKKMELQYIWEAFGSAYGLTLADDADAATARATLGLGSLAVLSTDAYYDLTHLLYPTTNNGYQELYRNGWFPVSYNQRWGGPWGGERPDNSGTDEWFATGTIDDQHYSRMCGQAAGNTWRAQAFKVPETGTYDAVWLKMCKAANPQKNNEPLNVYVVADSGGEPDEGTPITNGTMDVMDGPGFTADSMTAAGEAWPFHTGSSFRSWYRFRDASGSMTLTANTTYYVVVKATGADAVNYFLWAGEDGGNGYPNGNAWTGDDAVPSNWVEDTDYSQCFLIESATGGALIQSGTKFDGMLEFAEGNLPNESRAIQRSIRDFWNDEDFTLRMVTGTLTASKTLMDVNRGLLGKDRIRLYTDSTPNLCVSVAEGDGTTVSITDGTTDVSTGTSYDIMLRVRAKNDGADAVELFINGSAEGTQLTAQTLSFSDLFTRHGHITLGGGFPAEPTWDWDFKTDQFAGGNLPSNDGDTAWTTNTAATEASCMRILTDKDVMIQNAGYYGTGNEDGYYVVTAASLAEATGHAVQFEITIPYAVQTVGESAAIIQIDDDIDAISLVFHEEYMELVNSAWALSAAHNFHEPTVVSIHVKDDDVHVYLNGKLAIDGTGLCVNPSGGNVISFGDWDSTAGSEADVVWGEMLIYDAGPLRFEANNCQFDEFSYWRGDKTDLVDGLYNSGTPLSVKEVCGVKDNFIRPFRNILRTAAMTVDPTTTQTSAIADFDYMTLYCLVPEHVDCRGSIGAYSNTNQVVNTVLIALDGSQKEWESYARNVVSDANRENTYPVFLAKPVRTGMHTVGLRAYVGANTGKSEGLERTLRVEST